MIISTDQDFSLLTDPLVHHGHHFGHTAHALCCVHTLLTNSILHEVEQEAEPLESLSKEWVYHQSFPCLTSHHYFRQRREYCIYKQLLHMVSGLEDQLMNGSEEEILHIADLVHGNISTYPSYFLPWHWMFRYKKDLPMPSLMTRRVSRVQYLTGSHLVVAHWTHHLHAMSRSTVASIMVELGLCFVPLTWTGLTTSKPCDS